MPSLAKCAGVYLGYRTAFALQQGRSITDVEHLLSWRCLRQGHGVTAHVLVIIVCAVLKISMPDFIARQAKLNSLKLAVVPLLFHGLSPPRILAHTPWSANMRPVLRAVCVHSSLSPP